MNFMSAAEARARPASEARSLQERLDEVANALLVELPRDENAVWEAILDLSEDLRGFTYDDLRQRLPALAPVVINQYLARLKKAGILQEVEVALDGSSVYRPVRRPAEAPRLRMDGAPQYAQAARDQMWRAMKMIDWWTPRDLAIAASTDRCKIAERTARIYASHLFRAGYLFWRARVGVYRLKPFMNSGPIPPRVMKTSFVWDPNRAQIIGRGTGTEEVKL